MKHRVILFFLVYGQVRAFLNLWTHNLDTFDRLNLSVSLVLIVFLATAWHVRPDLRG